MNTKNSQPPDIPEHKTRVITSYSNTVVINNDQDRPVTAKFPRKIERPICGDDVLYTTNNLDEYFIAKTLPRKNSLKRRVKDNKVKAIAANISQMIIMIAPLPVYSRYTIDRYIAFAEAENITPVIFLNKTDLLTGSERKLNNDIMSDYKSLSYKTILHSVKNNDINLQELLSGKTSIIVGQSGVGKSSLVNKIIPELDILTGELSEKHKEGKHTTTHTQLYDLPYTGSIIDSPGVREYTPYFESLEQVQHGFIEFRELIQECKFRNCTHNKEHGCAIKKAVSTNKITDIRYKSYLDIISYFQ